MFKKLALTALVALGLGSPAFAQTATPVAIVVASCEVAGIFGPAGRSAPLTVDTAGVLCTAAGGGGGGTSSTFGAAFPATGTAVGMKSGANMVPFFTTNGTALDVNVTAGSISATSAADATAAAPSYSEGISEPLSQNLSGDLRTIAKQSGSWTVAGTGNFTVVNAGTFAAQAAQSGTWTVQPGNTANTTAWLVTGTGGTFPVTGTFWQATQPISAASLPLPTGAATAANQQTDALTDTQLRATPVPISGTVTVTDGAGALNVIVDSSALPTGAATEATLGGVLTSSNFAAAFGTAGTADTQVMSVQGIASMTPLIVGDGTGAFNVIVDSGTLTTVTGITNPVTVTDGAGALNVIVDSGTVAATQSGSWSLAANQSVNVAQMNGVATTMGNGASGTGVQRVTIANDSTGILAAVTNVATIGTSVTPGTAAANLGKAEDAAHTTGDVGVQALALLRATPTATAADNDYAPPIMDTNQRLWTSGTGLSAVAVPPNATYLGAGSDNGLAAGTAALTGLIVCSDSVVIDGAASGNTELVALTASETIYVCGYSVIAAGTVEFQLIYGTGTACATGETNLTGNYNLTAQAGIVDGSPFFRGMKAAVSNALCYELSGAIAVDGVVYYTKF